MGSYHGQLALLSLPFIRVRKIQINSKFHYPQQATAGTISGYSNLKLKFTNVDYIGPCQAKRKAIYAIGFLKVLLEIFNLTQTFWN